MMILIEYHQKYLTGALYHQCLAQKLQSVCPNWDPNHNEKNKTKKHLNPTNHFVLLHPASKNAFPSITKKHGLNRHRPLPVLCVGHEWVQRYSTRHTVLLSIRQLESFGSHFQMFQLSWVQKHLIRALALNLFVDHSVYRCSVCWVLKVRWANVALSSLGVWVKQKIRRWCRPVRKRSPIIIIQKKKKKN